MAIQVVSKALTHPVLSLPHLDPRGKVIFDRLYRLVQRNLSVNATPLSSVSDHQRRDAQSVETLVASFVTFESVNEMTSSVGMFLDAQPHADSQHGLDVQLRGIFGVNYSLHQRANRDSSLSLKGILKGCAEQNALGALAAQGVPFSAVREVYLYAERVRPCSHQSHLVAMPCVHCWRYLAQVGKAVHDCSNRRLHVFAASSGVSGTVDGLPLDGYPTEIAATPFIDFSYVSLGKLDSLVGQ